MRFIFTFIVLCLFLIKPVQAQNPVFSYVDSVRVDGAGTWGVVSTLSGKLNVTSSGGGNIYYSRYDTNLVEITQKRIIASKNDLASDRFITDHKHIYYQGSIYLSFSTDNNDYLYLAKYDTNGTRQQFRTVVNRQVGQATNDMMLAAHEDTVHLVWGRSGFTHFHARYLASDLSFVDSTSFRTAQPWPQLGTMIYKDGELMMFNGDETQNHLTAYFWNRNFTAKTPWTQRLLQGRPMRWFYFVTGVQWDQTNERWYLGYHEFLNNEKDQERLWIAAFDKDFNVLDTLRISEKGYFRPHFAQVGNQLFVTYDKVGEVAIKKFRVKPSITTSVDDLKIEEKPKSFLVTSNYPNPFNPSTTITIELSQVSKISLNVYNVLGQKVATLANNKSLNAGKNDFRFDASNLTSGIYLYEVIATSNNGKQEKSIQKMSLIK